ncbi:hypothetical protein KEM54_005451 [Ascosphaera aggregata]|nr:hypothetical protein KEM54_005451 [Ascosphaera aggregata]
MGFLESSAVGTILVSVGVEFDDTMHVQWVVLAYMLTYLAAVITGASIACGFAQSLPQLIAFRVVQGLGGAGLYAMPTIMLPEITPIEHFNLMGALMGMSMTVSAVW